jgi:hypothetical protein
MDRFRDCHIEEARSAVDVASKAPSDIAAILRLGDRSLRYSRIVASDFLSKAAALAKHAEEALTRPTPGGGGITLEAARQATLKASARLRDSMATIEEGEDHVG